MALRLVGATCCGGADDGGAPRDALGAASAELVSYYQNNNACGAAACPRGQVRTCGNVCVTPVANGGLCSRTDRASNSVCADPTASCAPDGLFYRCQVAPTGGKTILVSCDTDPNGCAHDLFCKDLDACNGSGGWGKRCTVGVDEGYACDSDWSAPGCAPCMPKSSCQNKTGGWGTCMVTGCTTDASCPCSDDGVTSVNGCDSTAALCKPCVHNGDECSENVKCCDPNTHCGTGGACCKNAGQACISNSDCCPGAGESICRSSGVCGVCTANGSACSSAADCCSGACSGGVCQVRCVAGKACSVPGAQGVCKPGKIVCPSATCSPDVGPTNETCDGKDNNCDGKADELLAGTACPSALFPAPVTIEGFACQQSFTATNGKSTCVAGVPGCRAQPGVNFCTMCGKSLPGLGGCGACETEPCSAANLCAPGLRCDGGFCVDVQACPNPLCWMPSDVGNCP